MALLDYVRPGYPKVTRDASGVRKQYEMLGPTTFIVADLPDIGDTWVDGNPVANVTHERVGVSAWTIATVETYKIDAKDTVEKTDEQYPFWEIDQVQIEKSIKQHPAFSGITAEGWGVLAAWEAESDQKLKAAFRYYERNENGEPGNLGFEFAVGPLLSYAKLRLRGVDSYLDFSPVVRKTSRYIGSVAPVCADVGQKEAEESAPEYAPPGYQWLKTADRVTKTGTKGIEWIRQEEWTGARKILIDKDSVFITELPPDIAG